MAKHTQLVYTDETETSATIQRTMGIRFGLKVFRAAEEPDAPREPLLEPYPSDEMAAHITTTRVNNSGITNQIAEHRSDVR